MMVSLLDVQSFQICAGIVNRIPSSGDEKALLSFTAFDFLRGEELWPHVGKVQAKPLLAEEK